jgi:DNA-directed RNA polymerase specialized sigma subunit
MVMALSRTRHRQAEGQLALNLDQGLNEPWQPSRLTPCRLPARKPRSTRPRTLLYQENCPQKRREEERLVQRHIPLLKTIIKQQYQKYRCVEVEDLYSLGLIGLLKAVRRFDPAKGFKFSTIALPFILGEWRHYIRDHNFWLKAPGSVRQRGMQARRLLERGDSIAEVCTKLGISSEELKLDLRATTGMGHELGHFELHDADDKMDSGWL